MTWFFSITDLHNDTLWFLLLFPLHPFHFHDVHLFTRQGLGKNGKKPPRIQKEKPTQVTVKRFNREQRCQGAGMRTAVVQGRKVREEPAAWGPEKQVVEPVSFYFLSLFFPPYPKLEKEPNQPSNHPYLPKANPKPQANHHSWHCGCLKAVWFTKAGTCCRSQFLVTRSAKKEALTKNSCSSGLA